MLLAFENWFLNKSMFKNNFRTFTRIDLVWRLVDGSYFSLRVCVRVLSWIGAIISGKLRRTGWILPNLCLVSGEVVFASLLHGSDDYSVRAYNARALLLRWRSIRFLTHSENSVSGLSTDPTWLLASTTWESSPSNLNFFNRVNQPSYSFQNCCRLLGDGTMSCSW